MLVLIAEDDPHTRSGLAEVLQGEGFHVLQAVDGEQAWEKYNEFRPEFLCLDVMMPRLNGYELCRKIRKVDSETPIIFLTAKGEEIDRVVGLEIGGDDYIVKPFAVNEVLARIRAVARRCLSKEKWNCDESHNKDFLFGDLHVFPGELRAKRGGEAIDLSLRDVKILQILAKSPGQVVARMALMHHAWGHEYVGATRTIDQHISQLRKRIERDPKNPQLIQTVHGVGYRYDRE